MSNFPISSHPTEQTLKAFADKIDKGSHDECWEWTGAKKPTGYGEVTIDYKAYRAHRVSWTFFFGDIPEGLHVLHKCDNPGCVNPYHLFLGSHQDNMTDCARKGRSNGRTLYNEEIWLVRRLLSREISQDLIARMFKISQSTVSRINLNPKHPSKGTANV